VKSAIAQRHGSGGIKASINSAGSIWRLRLMVDGVRKRRKETETVTLMIHQPFIIAQRKQGHSACIKRSDEEKPGETSLGGSGKSDGEIRKRATGSIWRP
jgi:hypothetical protein